MGRFVSLAGSVVIVFGLAACAQTADVTPFPDLRLPDTPAPAALNESERAAAIADLQNAAATNARLAE